MQFINRSKEVLNRYDFKKCVKKQQYVFSCKMDDDFFILTERGVIEGKKGDYVIIDIDGSIHLCKKEVYNLLFDNDNNYQEEYELYDI